jgi:hypothetical protein
MGEAKRKEAVRKSNFTREKLPPYDWDDEIPEQVPGRVYWVKAAIVIVSFYAFISGVIWYFH